MPVRLIVTNNGDKPISLRDARILFLTQRLETGFRPPIRETWNG